MRCPASKAEQVLEAMEVRLETVPDASVERNSMLPEKIPARRALDRGRAGHGLDRRLGPAIGQAEGETTKGPVSFERGADLPEEVVEGGVPDDRIALLDVNLDLDRVPVVGVPEATERLLWLVRIAVAQDDNAPG